MSLPQDIITISTALPKSTKEPVIRQAVDNRYYITGRITHIKAASGATLTPDFGGTQITVFTSRTEMERLMVAFHQFHDQFKKKNPKLSLINFGFQIQTEFEEPKWNDFYGWSLALEGSFVNGSAHQGKSPKWFQMNFNNGFSIDADQRSETRLAELRMNAAQDQDLSANRLAQDSLNKQIAEIGERVEKLEASVPAPKKARK